MHWLGKPMPSSEQFPEQQSVVAPVVQYWAPCAVQQPQVLGWRRSVEEQGATHPAPQRSVPARQRHRPSTQVSVVGQASPQVPPQPSGPHTLPVQFATHPPGEGVVSPFFLRLPFFFFFFFLATE